MTAAVSAADRRAVPSLSEEQYTRAIQEVVRAAEPEHVGTKDLVRAGHALEDLLAGAALWEAWVSRRVQVGWDADARELRFRAADPADEEAR